MRLWDRIQALWWRVRTWWARRFGDGVVAVTPRLRTVTYRRYERACLLLDLDPDKVRQGNQSMDEADLGDVYVTGETLIELVCRNDARIVQVLRQSSKPVAEEIVAHVMAAFFLRSIATFSEQKQSYVTTQSDALSRAISKGKAGLPRPSADR